MAACRRVYDSRHLQAFCQEPESSPEFYAGQSSMGYLYAVVLWPLRPAFLCFRQSAAHHVGHQRHVFDMSVCVCVRVWRRHSVTGLTRLLASYYFSR